MAESKFPGFRLHEFALIAELIDKDSVYSLSIYPVLIYPVRSSVSNLIGALVTLGEKFGMMLVDWDKEKAVLLKSRQQVEDYLASEYDVEI